MSWLPLSPFAAELLVRGLILSGVAGAVAWMLRGHSRTAASAAGLCALLLLPAAMLLPGFEVKVYADSGTQAAGAGNAWTRYIGVAWMAGFLLSATRIVPGLIRLRRWRLAAEPLTDARILTLADAAARSLGLRRMPELLLREPGAMPVACGVTRGVIFLPEDAMDWSEDRLRIVLLHEMAHLRRRDPAMQIFGWIACAVHWFNPLAWLLHRVWMRGREHATDALVLTTGVRPRGYATHLVEIACSRRTVETLPVAAMAAGGLEQRVVSILKWSAPVRRGPAFPVIALCLTGAAGVFAASFVRVTEIHAALSPEAVAEVEFRLSADPFPAS